MSAITDAIFTALDADATLDATLTGGVHRQRFDRNATAAAFDSVGTPKPAATVLDRSEDRDLTGLAVAFSGLPQVWFQAPDTAAGRTAFETAIEAARSLLSGKQIAGPNGTGARVAVAGRVGPEPDPVIAGALTGYLRLQVAGLWSGAGL